MLDRSNDLKLPFRFVCILLLPPIIIMDASDPSVAELKVFDFGDLMDLLLLLDELRRRKNEKPLEGVSAGRTVAS